MSLMSFVPMNEVNAASMYACPCAYNMSTARRAAWRSRGHKQGRSNSALAGVVCGRSDLDHL